MPTADPPQLKRWDLSLRFSLCYNHPYAWPRGLVQLFGDTHTTLQNPKNFGSSPSIQLRTYTPKGPSRTPMGMREKDQPTLNFIENISQPIRRNFISFAGRSTKQVFSKRSH